MDTRKFTSLCLAWSFVILTITSIILYIMPSGKIAFWSNWTMLGMDKHQWGALHTNIGYLFLAACLLHIVLNWKLILNYMKKKSKEAFSINWNTISSVVVVLIFSVFTLAEIPPVSWIQTFGEGLKESAEVKQGSPPYGHAELSSLELYCIRTQTDLEEAKRLLDEAGVSITGVDQSIADIAAANDLTPQDISKIITPNVAALTSSAGFGTGKRMGQMTLTQISETTGVPLEELQEKLSDAGLNTDPDKTLKEIAAADGKHPSELVMMLGLED